MNPSICAYLVGRVRHSNRRSGAIAVRIFSRTSASKLPRSRPGWSDRARWALGLGCAEEEVGHPYLSPLDVRGRSKRLALQEHVVKGVEVLVIDLFVSLVEVDHPVSSLPGHFALPRPRDNEGPGPLGRSARTRNHGPGVSRACERNREGRGTGPRGERSQTKAHRGTYSASVRRRQGAGRPPNGAGGSGADGVLERLARLCTRSGHALKLDHPRAVSSAQQSAACLVFSMSENTAPSSSPARLAAGTATARSSGRAATRAGGGGGR